jgi:hypothetical protein
MPGLSCSISTSVLRYKQNRFYSAFKRLKPAKHANIKLEIHAAMIGERTPPCPRERQKLWLIQ